MKSILAITFLLSPSIHLSIRTRAEYEEKLQYSFGNLLALFLLITYVLLISSFGASWVDGTLNSSPYSSLGFKIFPLFFIFPGIAVGIILFPKISAEYTNLHMHLMTINSLESFKFIGWVFLLFLIIINSAYRSM